MAGPYSNPRDENTLVKKAVSRTEARMDPRQAIYPLISRSTSRPVLFHLSFSMLFIHDAWFAHTTQPSMKCTLLLLFQHRKSDHEKVVLQDANLHTSGKYKCEVSAEAPNFHSVNGDGNMEVIGEWTGVAFN